MADESVLVRLRMVGAASMSRDAKLAAHALDGLGASASRAEAKGMTRLYRASRSLGSGLATVQRYATAAAIGIGTVGAAATGFAGRAGWQMNQTLDRQRIGFESFTGSAKDAEWIIRQVQKLAKDSPALGVESAGAGVQSLMAYGIEAKRAIAMTRVLSDQAAASGQNIDQAMQLGSLAIGQIAAKGKLSAEELNQLTESVKVNRKLVARNLGMTGAEFARQMQAGKITAEKAIPAITKAMQQSSAGAQRRLAATTEGQIGRLRDLWSQAAGQMTRPFYDAAGRIAARLSERMEKVDWDRIGKQAAAMFGTAVRFIQGVDWDGIISAVTRFGRVAITAGRDLIEAFRPAMPFVRNVLLPILKGIGESVLEIVVVAFKIAVPVIRVFSTALGWIGQRMEPLRPLMETVGRLIGFLFPGSVFRAIKIFGRGIGGAGGAAGVFGKVASKGVSLVVRPVKAVAGAVKRLWGGFRGAARGITKVFTDAWRVIKPVVQRVIDATNKVSRLAAALNPMQWGEAAAGATTKAVTPPMAAGTNPLGMYQPGPKAAPRAPVSVPSAKPQLEVPVHTRVYLDGRPIADAVTRGERRREAVR